eukprot:NODE_219_length_2278_cov_98.180381_g213_i0.p1 GENE.NODE_219_length_2278_cov_98.180381_g213_i0~~NODE_219_length_2278_cov_98.180381_g213_i0.p1  ORF type:complete len:670 (+),score=161.85 NODE_219_length_2278_cov_98.180381_g213_i0:78-2087(+)
MTQPAAGAPPASAQSASGNASLYVGDLHPEVNEAMLFEVFKDVGPVLSIRVCRDSVTRRSLGYAYVNFQNPSDAAKCIEQLRYHMFKDKPCRIMWSQRNPALRRSNQGNIFIKNLAESIGSAELAATFGRFGDILSCKVVTGQDGTSLGYGFVHFAEQSSADEAVQKVNGMLIEGNQVFVGPFVKRSQRLASSAENFTNVYIKHLATHVTQEELQAAASEYGEVQSCCVVKKDDINNKGFGFVNYHEHDDAQKLITALHDTTDEGSKNLAAPGKTLYVTRHQKKAERLHLRDKYLKERQMRLAKYVNLYIKNLDDTVDDDKLRQEFEGFGTIISAKIMRDESGNSKGFGFVSYREQDAATKALEMNGRIGLSSKPLYVAVAQRKEERRVQLEQSFGRGPQYGAGVFRPQAQGGLPGVPGGPAAGPYPGAMYGMYQPNPAQLGQGGFPYGGGGPRGMPPRGWNQAMGGPGGQMGMPGAGGPRGPYSGAYPGPRGRGPMGGRGGLPGAPGGAPPRGAPPNPAGGLPGRPPHPAPKPSAAPLVGQQYSYKQSARNMPGAPPPAMRDMAMPQHPMPQQAGVAVSTAAVPGNLGDNLTSGALAAMSPEQQKNALGERLFSSITDTHPDLAAKITGMLLEMDNGEILNLLESPQLLQNKVQEAISVLNAHPEDDQ